MSDTAGIHYGASEPRHDGAAIPQFPSVFSQGDTSIDEATTESKVLHWLTGCGRSRGDRNTIEPSHNYSRVGAGFGRVQCKGLYGRFAKSEDGSVCGQG